MNALVAVGQSLPRFCQVCQGERVLRVVSLFGIPAVFATPCPHCSPQDGVKPIEVPVPPPYRIDTPRSA